MVVVDFSGVITTTTSEANLFSISGSVKGFETILFCDAVAAGDSFEFKVYLYDINDAVIRVYKTFTVTGVQSDPAIVINWLTTRQYKVSVKKLAGTNRDISWVRNEI